MRRQPWLAFVLVGALGVGAVPAQATYYYYPDDNSGIAYSNPAAWFPWFTNVTGTRYQILVPASVFATLPPGAALTSIGVFFGSTNTGAPSATFTILQVRLGPAAVPALTDTFDTNLLPAATTLVVDQPGTGINDQGTTGAWVDFVFPTPYVYGSGDLIVDTQTQISSSGVYMNSSVGPNTPRLVSTVYTGQAMGTLVASGGTKVRFGAAPVAQWQANQAGADLSIDFAQTAPPIVTTVPVGQTALVVVSSTGSAVYPWDMALTLGAPVPAGAGGLVFPDGQIVNLDLGDPTLYFLSLTIPPPLFTSPLILPISSSVPLSLSAQTAHYDPAAPLGIWLSAANQLVVQ